LQGGGRLWKGEMMMNRQYKQSSNDTYNKAVEKAVEEYENVTGKVAIRTRQMILDYGSIGALEALMDNADIQKGFKALRDNNKLAKTFEATMVEFSTSVTFEKKALEVAKFRLQHPYMA
jgi:hypothetical protein